MAKVSFIPIFDDGQDTETEEVWVDEEIEGVMGRSDGVKPFCFISINNDLSMGADSLGSLRKMVTTLFSEEG